AARSGAARSNTCEPPTRPLRAVALARSQREDLRTPVGVRSGARLRPPVRAPHHSVALAGVRRRIWACPGVVTPSADIARKRVAGEVVDDRRRRLEHDRAGDRAVIDLADR